MSVPHSMPTRDHVRNLFRNRGLRCTRQREEVYRALAASHTHPTADELFHSVRTESDDTVASGLSLATVYNTLEAFVNAGICQRVPSPGNAGRYDADVHDHVHLTLPDGQVIDLPEDLSSRVTSLLTPELIAEIEQRTGARIEGVQVQFLG